MSSLRNSLHRRNHKERSQLAHRARLGILEKHKDYVLRARDYHSKQDRLTRLRQKAAERNKDEFYFAMNRQRTEGGVHVQDRGNVALPVDIVKVLKTQDENYLRTMRTAGLKKIDKLKNQLSALADLIKPVGDNDGEEDELDEDELNVLREAGIISVSLSNRIRKSKKGRTGKHIVFIENEGQAREYAITSNVGTPSQDVNMDLPETQEEDLGWKTPDEKGRRKRSNTMLRKDPEDAEIQDQLATEERREATALHRTRLLKELSARLFRDKQLRYAERELEMQRLLMGKGNARKLKGVEKVEEDSDDGDDEDESSKRNRRKVDEKTWKPRVYKWRVERKK
ncbi:hypothetical protein AcW1_001293 [Taiwanofungus camphoratus]|nr:hypothetical protein AcW2_000183 [Antrodia cinnamomea]KAI0937271.1 hypothetical protein AcV5_005215 [Antrodia cinnamomea]KAI0962479.1 hypothetical protein AcV7_001315 [Antrodia cinnamomea]KAI0964483.1 hypothetical protein AcW1_001293 [Antrodia cinnamomea]